MTFIEVDGHALHATVHGNGARPALILLHSLGTSSAVWAEQVEAFEPDFRVVCPDFRGHGSSEVSRHPVTIESLASDVVGLADALGLESFHLAGVSIGGLVAQAIGGQSPESVRSATLFDTSLASTGPAMWLDRADACRRDGLASLAEGILSAWVTPEFRGTPAGRGLATILERTPDEGYAACCEALASADCRDHAGRIEGPITIALGEFDTATPRSASDTLADAMGGLPVHTIAGAAHIPLLEAPREVNRLIRASVERAS